MVAKYRCHCVYTNENSDNDNQRQDSCQRATSECGVSFKQKLPKIIWSWILFQFQIAMGLRRGNKQKKKLRKVKQVKEYENWLTGRKRDSEAYQIFVSEGFISILDFGRNLLRFFCFGLFFLHGFSVSNRPLCLPPALKDQAR